MKEESFGCRNQRMYKKERETRKKIKRGRERELPKEIEKG
jgi:hypothetical protein